MRCLYCGKGLALLKRLRGGGEFCSDAHRLKYQEEYNELALSRLLQAQPPEEKPKTTSENGAAPLPNGQGSNGLAMNGSDAHGSRSDFKPAAPSIPPAPATSTQVRPAALSPAVATVERPVAVAERPQVAARLREPVPEPQPEAQPPAPMAGFVLDPPALQRAQTPSLVAPQLEFAVVVRPEQPRLEVNAAPLESQVHDAPAWAGALTISVAAHGVDSGLVVRATGVEVRESTRMAPVTTSVIEMHSRELGPGSEADREWALRDQPRNFTLPPVAPENWGPAWLGGVQEFAPLPLELGDLGRLALSTDGFTGITAAEYTPPSVPVPEPAAQPEPQPAPAAPMWIAPHRDELSSAARSTIEPVHPEPVQIDPAFLQSLANLEVSAGPASAPVSQPEPAAPLESEAELPAAQSGPPQTDPPTPVEPPFQVRERVTKPLPLTLHGFPPGRGKGAQIFTTSLRATPEIQVPATGTVPLRAVMLFGPAPAAPAPAPVSPEPASAPPVSPTPADATPVPAVEPSKTSTNARPHRKPPGSGDRVGESIVEAVKLRRPASSVAGTPLSVEAVKPAPAPESKPVKTESGGPKREAKTEPKTEAKSEAKPALKTEPKPELKRETPPAPSAVPVTKAATVADVDLGLPSLQLDATGRSRMPAPTVLVAVLLVVAAIGAGVYKLSGKNPKAIPAAPSAPVSDVVETGPLAVAESGWIDDWAPQPPNPKVLRVLSLLRGSMPLSDYRMEFEAQIESKALGWVFRALNQKNYYVTKLEVVKPGIDPTVEVVHFAMIDGEEAGARVRVPLTVPVRVDTSYKVRFDVLGDRFTTYVQGQKVDEWTDNRISKGGAGLYRERGESALLKGTVRMTLIAKKK